MKRIIDTYHEIKQAAYELSTGSYLVAVLTGWDWLDDKIMRLIMKF